MKQNIGKLMGFIFMTFVLSCLFVLPVRAESAQQGPTVTKARMLDEQVLEIQWNEEVENGSDYNNFSVYVNGSRVALTWYGWYEDSGKGAVYVNQKSTIRLNNSVSLTNFPTITLKVSSSIQDANGNTADATVEYPVVYEPYYTQSLITNCGVEVKSSSDVQYSTLEKAGEMIDFMLSKDEELAQTIVKNGGCLGVYGPDETPYDIPEHREAYETSDRYVEGYGGSMWVPISTIAEANVLRLTTGDYVTLYQNESVLVHEFGHAVKNLGVDNIPALKAEYDAAYQNAVDNNLWPDTYAISNSDEFFATMCAIWFNVMDESYAGDWDGVRGPVNTRDELYVYDETTYNFFCKIFPFDGTLPSPWDQGTNYHDVSNGVKAVDITKSDENGEEEPKDEDPKDEDPKEEETRLIENAKISLKTSFDYTGKAIKPVVTVTDQGVKLTKGEDYTLSYENNVNAGKASVIVTGKGKYTGSVKKSFQIQISVGKSYKVGNFTYKVTGKDQVTLSKASSVKKKLTIPAKVTIGGKSFSITAIGSNAFANCKKLQSVVIHKNVKSIGKKAFYGCKNLKLVKVQGGKKTSIGKNAFKGIHKKAVIRYGK
jgi:hypothetical protein